MASAAPQHGAGKQREKRHAAYQRKHHQYHGERKRMAEEDIISQ